ncbi:MAG: hypothetical protein K2K41_01625, partial [Ruminiclostridium sp.]|nr:hypothetical protein [Ruminiclostridium sp.]
AIVLTVVLILNIVGIFIVNMTQMIIAYIAGMILLFIPTLVSNVLKKSGESWVKYLYAICAILFTSILTVILTKHAVLLYVYPIAISSLYFSSRLNIFSTVLTIIAVSAAQLISFYIPCDKDANFSDLKGVTLFGIFPRAMVLFAIAMIFTMLCKRTAALLGSLMSAEQQEQIREKSAEVSNTLVKAVTEMDGISARSAESGKNAAAEYENVLRDSEANAEHIKSGGENMNAIAENLQNLNSRSCEIERLLNHSDEITAENNSAISLAEGSMKEIFDRTENTLKIIKELSKQSKRISEVVKMIEDISMQTDILAINAAIEAAHAGAAGKGFAVVSEEIGILSDRTKSSAGEIGTIISQFTNEFAEAVSSMEQNFTLTLEGMENMKRIKSLAENLSSSNSEISENVGYITDLISQVAESSDKVTGRLADVSENISNNYTAVLSVSETIMQNSRNIEAMSRLVKSIRELSEQLNALAL